MATAYGTFGSSCPFGVNQPPLMTCAPAEPLGPPFAHYPNKNLSCKMVTGPGGMPFVRCDNYVPQFATGPSDSVNQPSNNNSSSFGDFYSNTSSLPAIQVTPPKGAHSRVAEMGLEKSQLGRPAPLERLSKSSHPKPPQHKQPHKDGSMWIWLVAIGLVALLLLAVWKKPFY